MLDEALFKWVTQGVGLAIGDEQQQTVVFDSKALRGRWALESLFWIEMIQSWIRKTIFEFNRTGARKFGTCEINAGAQACFPESKKQARIKRDEAYS